MSWDKDKEGWVSFRYERLPNLCYWCGSLTHDDKDCVIWLNSRGNLSSSTVRRKQRWRSWVLTNLRRTGFKESCRRSTTTVGKVRNNKNGSTVNAGVENNEETVQTSMEVDRSGGPQSGDGTARLDETTLQRQNSDFEERVRDIDDALNYAP